MLAEWISVSRDLTLTVSAAIAAYVGLRGLNTWRQQLTGKAEYDLAKSLLKATYELREAIAAVRHPFMQHPQEPEMSEEKKNELSQRQRHWHALVQAYQKRWESVPKARSVLDANLLEAEVVWGRRVVDKATPLYSLVGELYFVVQEHFEATNPQARSEDFDADQVKRRRDILYARLNGEDDYKKRVDAAIREFENELRPHITQYHR